jgi:hypothetical protein
VPTLRLRKRLLDRLVKGANSAGELGLALLMTAGVAHCGGSTGTHTGTGQGSTDGAADHQLAVEAPQGPDGGYPAVEAAVFPPDAGSDGHPSPIIEAPAPAPDSGSDAHSPLIEAATFPDAGSDAHPSPWVEAPLVAPN